MKEGEYYESDFDAEACEDALNRIFSGQLVSKPDEIVTLRAELASLRGELAAAKEQLEFDRTTCHNFLKALDKTLDGRFWLTEGRGSYSWDDDRYRSEFHDAAVALSAILDPMRKMAQNLSSRLPTTEAVMNARVDLQAKAAAATARAEAAEKELAETKKACASNAKAWLDCVEESAIKRTHLMAEIGLTEQQRDAALLRATQAEAQAGRLREKAEAMVQRWDTPGWKDVPHTAVFINALRAVIAETPAQSLAKHDAEVLRKAASKFEAEEIETRNTPPGDNYEGGYYDGQYSAANWLMGEVARLEQQAAGEEAPHAE